MTDAVADAVAGRVVRVDVLSAPHSRPRTGHRFRRARAVVLTAVSVFVAVQFGLSRAVESDVLPVRDPIFAEKFDLLRSHPAFFAPDSPRPRILTVGSSRTLLSVDAESLGTKWNAAAFNFGCSGCGPITTALYVRRAFAAGARAETVLIELHPAMLADLDPPLEHRWLHEYRLTRDEVELLRGYGWRLADPVQHRSFGWLNTTHTYRFAALDRYAPGLSPCPFGMMLRGRSDRFGFVRGTDVTPSDRSAALLRECALYLPALVNHRFGGAAMAAVRDTVSRCRARGATPVLLLSAESSEFRNWYGLSPVSVWATEFARECGVRLIDAREWLPDAMFADGHHPTADGATAFTARLAEELRR